MPQNYSGSPGDILGAYYLVTGLKGDEEKWVLQKHAKINATASGDTTVVSAVTGAKIRVISVVFTCSEQVNVAWKSGASTTKINAMPWAALGGMAENFKPGHFFETDSGEAAVINLSKTANVRGILNYIEV